MNILIPDSWLREYLKTSAKVKQIAQYLSCCSQSVEKIIQKDNDYVYEIEITTNRPDCLSVWGIAKELSVILPQFNLKAKLKPVLPKEDKIPEIKNGLPLKVVIEKTSLCPRFTALIFDNIIVHPSPKIIQKRLQLSGIRALNNVVDISNYLMLELGQPMHTFDYDKIKGAKMILREAKEGEKIITLDGKTRFLPAGAIIIEDGEKRIIDLCGIMGGENSAVDSNTKRILLFVQTYDPVKIRQTCQTLGFQTEAALRFEKGVNPEGVLLAMKKAISLFQKNCQAKVASKLIDIYPRPQPQKTVGLNLDLVEKRIGVKIEKKKVITILQSLGFSLLKSDQKKQFYSFSVPHWRYNDISIPEDLIEEIARIHGYHRIPNILPPGTPPQNSEDPKFWWEEKIKEALKYWGFTETVNYSMVAKTMLQKAGFKPEEWIKIKNPLTKDLVYMRPSLIPSLLNVIVRNQAQYSEIKIFELANIYLPLGKDKLPQEQSTLTAAITGDNFYLAKGIVEALFEEMGINNPSFQPIKSQIMFHPFRAAKISFDKKILGLLGEIKPDVLASFRIKNKVIIFELNLEVATKYASNIKFFSPISKYPPLSEDLTFVVPPKTFSEKITKTIIAITPLIKEAQLIDCYKNNLTFRIVYQDLEKNLTSQEVEQLRKKIIQKVEKKFAAKLKGIIV